MIKNKIKFVRFEPGTRSPQSRSFFCKCCSLFTDPKKPELKSECSVCKKNVCLEQCMSNVGGICLDCRF